MLGLYDKLGAPNRAAAVHAARRLGVLADRARAVRERTGRAGCACSSPTRTTSAAPACCSRCTGARVGRGERRRPHASRTRSRSPRSASQPRARSLRRRRRGAGRAAFPGALLLRDDGDGRAGRADERRPPGAAAVSPRERDVLTAFAAGATNPAIARELGLSPNTVKQHASSIFRKLGVRNRAEAVRRADELGLLAA